LRGRPEAGREIRDVSLGETCYRIETGDGCYIVTLLPELNERQWSDIDKVGTEIVERLNAGPVPKLLIDLTQVNYMGSATVALIVRVYKTVHGRNGRLAIVNQHELVYEVLKLAGLAKLWTFVDSREKGYTALGVRGGSALVSRGEQGGSTALVLAGAIGVVGAVIGLALQFSSTPLVPAKAAQLIEFGFAALGMIVGTMILVNHTGGRRTLGIAFLAVCLLVILGGIVAAPERRAPGPSEPKGSQAAPAAGATIRVVSLMDDCRPTSETGACLGEAHRAGANPAAGRS
jgi:anti-anti-sigma factor